MNRNYNLLTLNYQEKYACRVLIHRMSRGTSCAPRCMWHTEQKTKSTNASSNVRDVWLLNTQQSRFPSMFSINMQNKNSWRDNVLDAQKKGASKTANGRGIKNHTATLHGYEVGWSFECSEARSTHESLSASWVINDRVGCLFGSRACMAAKVLQTAVLTIDTKNAAKQG